MDHGDVIDLRHVKWHPCEALRHHRGASRLWRRRVKVLHQTIRQQGNDHAKDDDRRTFRAGNAGCERAARRGGTLRAGAGLSDETGAHHRALRAGGPNDLAVRPAAQKLYEFLGQPFVIDYRAGANGIIGCDAVAKAPPDGYTLVVISSSFSINSSTYAKLPFDPIRDFTPVGSLATSDIIFIVNPTVPVRSVKEFIALAKANPGKLTHGSSGTGGSLHLGAELLKQTAAINIVHIPYKGASLALTDVIGGHVDSMFISAPGAIGQIKAGKVRVLAIASPRRARALPDAPTFAEAGYPRCRRRHALWSARSRCNTRRADRASRSRYCQSPRVT